MSQLTPIDTRGAIARVARGMVMGILALGVVVGALAITVAVLAILPATHGGPIAMTLLTEAPLPDARVTGIPESERESPGTFSSATVAVGGLSLPVQVLAVADTALGALMVAMVAACGSLLAWRLLRGRPFRKNLSLTIVWAGALLLIGGIVQQGVRLFGALLAAHELNGDSSDPFWPAAAPLDLSAVGIGLVLLLVALVLEIGERLQHETDGLV